MDTANDNAALGIQDCETASSELAQGSQNCDAANACTSKIHQMPKALILHVSMNCCSLQLPHGKTGGHGQPVASLVGPEASKREKGPV